MPDVILKDAGGEPRVYSDIDSVSLPVSETETATFISQHLIQNQVQADWNQTDNTQPDYIKNKPEIFEAEDELPEINAEEDEGKVLGVLNGAWDKIRVSVSGSGSDLPEINASEDEGKVLGVVNGVWDKMTASLSGGVNADYAENDETAPSFIKNRPFYETTLVEEFSAETDLESATSFTVVFSETQSYTCTKISEWMPTKEQYLASTFFMSSESLGMSQTMQPEIANIATTNDVLVDSVQGMFICYTAGASIDFGTTITFPETGIYILGIAEQAPDIYISITYSDINQIDEKYLPILDYVRPEKVDILPLTTYSGFALNSVYGTYLKQVQATYDLVLGETYFINWDGNDYECIVQDANSVMAGAVMVGNGTNWGLSGNNEPFIIGFVNGFAVYMALTDTADGGFHSVRIYQITDEYYKVKKNYVSWNDLADKPFEQTEGVILNKVFQDEQYDSDGDGVADTWNRQLLIIDGSKATLIEGERYDVNFNGTVYHDLECFLLEGVVPCIGNGSYMGGLGDTTCPFIIARDTSGELIGTGEPSWACMLMSEDVVSQDGIYNVTISGTITKYLNNKYLNFINDWEEKEIFPIKQTTFALEFDNTTTPSESLYIYMPQTEEEFLAFYNLMPGRTYSLHLDGVSISVRAKDLSSSLPSGAIINKAVGLGNKALYSPAFENTGEPYFIGVIDVSYNGQTEQMASVVIQNTPVGETVNIQFGITQQAGGLIKDSYLPSNLGGTNGNGSSLPSVSTSDNDKVLTVVNGSWAAAEAPSGLPDVTSSDNNKVLKVVEGSWTVADGLPDVTTEENDKVLKVVDGAWAVADGLPDVTIEDAGKFLRVSDEGLWAIMALQYAEEVSF